MSIAAGELSELITLERPVKTTDSAGGEVVEWEEVAEVWARVLPMSAREQAAAPQVIGIGAYTYTIRRFDLIDETWRIKHGERILSVTGILRLVDVTQIMAEERSVDQVDSV
jgi:SPP1 family predicted phage head-tail adaptor